MTKKPNKFAQKAATEIQIGKNTIRVSPYLGKNDADHIRSMVNSIDEQKQNDPNFEDSAANDWLELSKGSRSAEAAAFKAKGLI